MFFPDPDGMALRDWADGAAYSMINYPNAWGLRDDVEWQHWGMMFFTDPFLSRYDPPNPYVYDNWWEWAKKLADSMSAAPDSPNGGAGGGPGPLPNGAFLITQDSRFIITQDGRFIITQGTGSPAAGFGPFDLTDDGGISQLTDDSGSNVITST